MVWTVNNIFESGRKFCPMMTTVQSICKVNVIAKKILAFPLTTQTPTWHACRDLCNTDERCEYFKWKVSNNIVELISRVAMRVSVIIFDKFDS